jgi:hypothetical protein
MFKLLKYAMCIVAIMLNNTNTSTASHLQKFKNKALTMCRSVRHMSIICDSMLIDERQYIPCESNEQCSCGKFCLNNVCEKGFPIESQEDEPENTYEQPTNIDRNPFINIMPDEIQEEIYNMSEP